MKLLAKHCLHINDFVGYHKEELDNKIDSYTGIKSPFLALWKYVKTKEGKDQEAQDVIHLSYVILMQNIPEDDFDAQYQAIDHCEIIADIINARIRADHHKPQTLVHRSFLENRTRIEPVVMSHLAFGVEVHLFFKNRNFLQLNADDWEDIDSVC